MFTLIAKLLEILLKDNREMQRLTIVIIYIFLTLVLLGGAWLIFIMQVSARIIAPTTPDPVDYAMQIAWSVGIACLIFGAAWGLVYPSFMKYMNKSLFPEPQKPAASKTANKPKGERS